MKSADKKMLVVAFLNIISLMALTAWVVLLSFTEGEREAIVIQKEVFVKSFW